MVDKTTRLIETAMQSDNEQEALAALRQARKTYRGTGSIVAPNRPEPAAPAQTDTSAMDAKVTYLEEQQRKLMADNAKLSAENTDLRKQLLENGNQADAELIELTNKKLRQGQVMMVVLPIIAVAVAVMVVAL